MQNLSSVLEGSGESQENLFTRPPYRVKLRAYALEKHFGALRGPCKGHSFLSRSERGLEGFALIAHCVGFGVLGQVFGVQGFGVKGLGFRA